MRNIDTIIIHCSASKPGVDLHAKNIDRMHREQNHWKCIGYHYIVCLDGTIEPGRDETEVGAHAKGYNGPSIGICYVGGLNTSGQAADTRTTAQKESLNYLVNDLCRKYPIVKVIGHRDISPDTNHNGKVDPWERIKAIAFSTQRTTDKFKLEIPVLIDIDHVVIQPKVAFDKSAYSGRVNKQVQL